MRRCERRIDDALPHPFVLPHFVDPQTRLSVAAPRPRTTTGEQRNAPHPDPLRALPRTFLPFPSPSPCKSAWGWVRVPDMWRQGERGKSYSSPRSEWAEWPSWARKFALPQPRDGMHRRSVSAARTLAPHAVEPSLRSNYGGRASCSERSYLCGAEGAGGVKEAAQVVVVTYDG